MYELKPESTAKLKELYRDFPELIDYRLKYGNVYEKAQAILIKSVVVGGLQAPESLTGSSTRKTPPDTHS